MFKKRISTWGLAKNSKKEDKEQALAKLLHNEASTTEGLPIRHDKLVRYAKTRARLGELDGHDLSKLVRRRGHAELKRTRLNPKPLRSASEMSSKESTSPLVGTLPRSLALPHGSADFDMFLRAMKELIRKEKGEWQVGPRGPPDVIFKELSQGIVSWRKGETTAAHRLFGQAARNVSEDIQGTNLSVSRITYCISSITWFSGREPVFQMFAEFMANAALESLGQGCPLTIVLRYLQAAQTLDAQLRIWACAVDGNPISEHNVAHWWGMVRRRWRWCARCGMNDLAAQYCREALSVVRGIEKLTENMEDEAQHDIASFTQPIDSEQTSKPG